MLIAVLYHDTLCLQRRLKEVRDQLDQLRQLVHYYQGQTDGEEGGAEQDELVSAAGYSDRGDHGSRQ